MFESNKLLVESVVDAAEKMAFVSPLPAEAPTVRPPLPVIGRMQFKGRCTWLLEMATGEHVGRVLAGNMLGVESDDAEAISRARDVLRELMNVTCGILLPKLDDVPTDQFDMGIPTVEAAGEATTWPLIEQTDGMVYLEAEGTPMVLSLRKVKPAA